MALLNGAGDPHRRPEIQAEFEEKMNFVMNDPRTVDEKQELIAKVSLFQGLTRVLVFHSLLTICAERHRPLLQALSCVGWGWGCVGCGGNPGGADHQG
jgi:hypothetical protein